MVYFKVAFNHLLSKIVIANEVKQSKDEIATSLSRLPSVGQGSSQ
ncbi:unnamed protein product [marine sediment metagenome]|uniref:Uncharacterized protein n=1 Tax=marine sediment metagenome TaxID=412755 RepID=X0W948_9ZZZZ